MHQSFSNNVQQDDKLSYWERSGKNVCLCISTFLLVALTGFLLYKHVGVLQSTDEATEIDICLDHAECIKASSEIMEFIDQSADPCQDFHAFVCGGYIGNPREDAVASHKLTQEFRLTNQLNSYVLKPISEHDSQAVQMQKKYFQACMNLTKIDGDQDETLMGLLDNIGGWPVLMGNKWNEKPFNWLQIMVNLKRLGLPFEWFLEMGVYQTDTNSLWISYPQTCGAVDDIKKQSYTNMMVDIAVNMSASRANAIREFSQVLNFETELVKACYIGKLGEIKTERVGDLQNMWPKIKWTQFIQEITERTLDDLKNITVIHNLNEYILHLDHLLIRTSKRIQANYIVWKIIESLAPLLSKRIRARFARYRDESFDDDENRLDFCLEDTKSRFDYVSETEFIRKHVTPETREAVGEMMNFIKADFAERISNANWMDEESKEINLDKLESIGVIVGGEDEIFDEGAFEQYLQIGELNFSSTNVIEMLTEKSLAHSASIFNSLGQPATNLTLSYLYPQNVIIDPILFTANSTMVLSAAMLQDFFYHPERPNYLNYATIGSLAGHELTHGLGTHDYAARYKIEGKTVNIWNDTILKFVGATGCLVRDYDSFEPHLKTKGRPTFEENYADSTGRRVAYYAYQKWVEGHGEEPLLPGLEYTQNQLFWIKSSIAFCTRNWFDPEEVQAEGDKLYRINGPLRNSIEFGQDFDCPVGSPMNPKGKCQVL